MLPIQVGIVSRSNSVTLDEVVKAAAAIGVQVTRDFQAIWNVRASVTALSDPDSIPPGVWPVFIVDDVGAEGAAGLHLTDHQQPYALVETGDTWTLTASHECVEMLVDPSGNRLVSSAAITVQNGDVADLPTEKFEYLVEAADPSEAPANAYMIDGVLVSDFYTPNFYDPAVSPGVRYSFTGKITRPRQVLPGGYISWLNPVLNRMQQLRWIDAPEIVDIPGMPQALARRTLRGFVDSYAGGRRALSRLAAKSPQVQRMDSRASWFALASAIRGGAYGLARRSSPAGELSPPDAAQRVLDAHLAALKAAGGTKAYIGWQFQNDWITRDRAIVVLAPSVQVPAVRNRLPAQLDGVPVEVRPDPRPQLPGPTGAIMFASAAPGTVREELAIPSFPNERPLLDEGTDAAAEEAARRPPKPQIQYRPPAGVSLAADDFDVTLTLHISPEQGWAQLKPFLQGTTSKLVVGMYEFTAPHIDTEVRAALPAPDGLTLTLDSPPERKGKREQTVEQTEQDLSGAVGEHLKFAWALSGLGTEAVAKAFPTAYHIKVAVRDSKSFWLSSGNWNTSNQPNVDPTDDEALTEAIQHNDRDWHVICDCEPLAKIFEAFLANDYAQAEQAAAGEGVEAAMAAAGIKPVSPPSLVDTLAVAAGKPQQFFAPRTVTAKMRIKPLLTPDDYRSPILELIRSAKSRFYMQTQYIHTVDPAKDSGDPTHMALISAVADLINNGVDVRLITSEFQTKPWIERLQDAGIDAVDHLRIQRNVHNKGIVVDSSAVVVSSQNWSGEGTGANRDAGLILFNADAARYFEEIFLHDWVNLANPISVV